MNISYLMDKLVSVLLTLKPKWMCWAEVKLDGCSLYEYNTKTGKRRVRFVPGSSNTAIDLNWVHTGVWGVETTLGVGCHWY